MNSSLKKCFQFIPLLFRNEDDSINQSLASMGEGQYYSDINSKTESTEQVKHQGYFITVVNILNTLVGAEILGMPNSLTLCGVVLAVSMMTLAAVLSYIATIMVIRLERNTGLNNVNAIARLYAGKWIALIYSILNLVFLTSAQIAYLEIGSDTISNWLRMLHCDSWTRGWRRAIVVGIYSMLIPVALSIPRNNKFLASASAGSVFVMLFYAAVVIYEGTTHLRRDGISPSAENYIVDWTLFNAFAMYTTTFAIPSVVLPLLHGFYPQVTRRYRLIGGAFIFCWILVVMPGVVQYLIFGKDTKQIVLGSYPSSDIVIQIMSSIFFIVVNASYPVTTYVMASDLSQLLFGTADAAKLPTCRRVFILAATNIPGVLVAMVLPSIRPVLEVGGAFGGCLCNFVYPPLLVLRGSKHGIKHWTNILCILFIIFGFTAAGIATYESVLDAIRLIKNPEE